MKDYIGRLTKIFESGDKGSLSVGQSGLDCGGSFGTYQFVLRYGVVIDFLKKFFPKEAKNLYYNGPDTASREWPGKEYSSSPDDVKKVWTACYNKVGPGKFFEYEHKQIKNICYDPCVCEIYEKTNIHIDYTNRAYQEMVWSGAVHFGAKTFANMFISVTDNMDELFDRLYEMRYEKMKEAYPDPGQRYVAGVYNGNSEVETLRPYLNVLPLFAEKEVNMKINNFKADPRVYRNRIINGRIGTLKDVKAIVHHYTGVCQQTARGNAEYFGTYESHANDPLLSIHFAVDDTEVWSCVPLMGRAGHCDDAGVGQFKKLYNNENTIGIEVCPHHISGKKYPDACEKGWYFSDTSIELLKQLDVYIINEIRKAGGETPALVRHYDITGKHCPAPWLENEGQWENFKKDVMSRINLTMTSFAYCDSTVRVLSDKIEVYQDATMRNVCGYYTVGTRVRAVQQFGLSDNRKGLRTEGGYYINAIKDIDVTKNNMKKSVVAVKSPDGVLTLRDFPSSYEGTKIREFSNGNLLRVIGEAYNRGDHWYLVDQGDAKDKFSGFVAARYTE